MSSLDEQFNKRKPLYLQIKEKIEDQIIKGQLKEHDQIPSTTEMVNFFKVNHITAARGVNLLVEEGTIYKKRGIGMFVAGGARDKLLQRRKDDFLDRYLKPLLKEANKLGLTDKELISLIKQLKEGDLNGI